ncbi:hypothetical protein BALCAV_0214975 [Alkalihalobacillus alcalophilus ATCC 27647 = CGMCC 1.3604]|nr:hypothetical protein [Alkalihalobacillus alcalophilus]KGA96623.1 hypothetical protein BALCAV_0214975 [Alkalihalobacillus alcalophilus ATCC 27647 = CGMCC 1.3604]
MRYNYRNIDLKQEYNYVVRRILKYYEDVIVVNQTNEYLDHFNLNVSKAFLIGGTPLDFGKRVRLTDTSLSRQIYINDNFHPLG